MKSVINVFKHMKNMFAQTCFHVKHRHALIFEHVKNTWKAYEYFENMSVQFKMS